MVRHWKKISCTAACLFSLALLAGGWGSLAQAQQSSTQAWSGWVGKVSDTTCGAKHKIADAKECTLMCVRNGAQYALVVGEPAAKVFTLEGHASDFERLAGAMAKVQGNLNGTTIKVSNVESFR